MYYGWIVVAVTVLTLLSAAGVRSAPGLLINPLESDLGWTRDGISFAVSVGLLMFGLAGPFAGRLMDRYGPRALMLVGLFLTGISTAFSAVMNELWQMVLLWGIVGGLGTGMAGAVLGATVANRWFTARRSLIVGLFGGATSAGQLVFIPVLAMLFGSIGWRTSVIILGGVALLAIIPVLFFMRDDPADVGLEPYGGPAPAPVAGIATDIGQVMRLALGRPEFWLLVGSFFICGATSNGLIGTHFIPHSIEHGIPASVAAGTLAMMGSLNFVGTVASGWLTDRADPRKLLAGYYIFRGLSLFLLPFALDYPALGVFAVVYGLDWIATVPPTTALCADLFGRRNVGVLFGWVFFAHQVGSALAAYLGGLARVWLGDYTLAFLFAGALAVIGGLMALLIRRPQPIATQLPSAAGAGD